MDSVIEIVKVLKAFRDEREWGQFHNSKDLAIAISIESNELLEQFLWKDPNDAKVESVKDEIADILAYTFLLADKYDFNIKDIILEKVKKNALKYPVSKSKGNAKKYNEL
jgi:NTP pyrophosphatase (non-canonical NTP hydrolase)